MGASFGSLVLIPAQAVFFGIVIDRLSKMTDLAVPWFVAFKALADILTNTLMFYQPNFQIALWGVFLNFFLGKGFFGPIILTMKTVVDPKAANISVSFALLAVNLNTLIVSQILSALEGKIQLDTLLFWVSNICQILVVPIFIIVGLKIRKMCMSIDAMDDSDEFKQVMMERR